MDERNLEPEEPAPRLLVDELSTLRTQALELGCDVLDREGDMVHAGAAPGEEAPDGGIGPERPEELVPPGSGPERGGLDPLLGDCLAVLDVRAEESGPALDGRVQIVHGDADVVDA